MHDLLIIRDIVVILLVSLPIIFIFKKFNLPSIVGFLLAGMIIGPYGFKLIASISEIEVLAEIGVIFLLFTIGLEISFSQLLRMKKFLIYAGGLQFTITIIVSSLILIALGIDIKDAIFYGMLISLSSTAIVLKILSDENQLQSPHGKISLGILIFQDLAIVPLFLIVPILGAEQTQNISSIFIKLLLAFSSIVVIVLLSKFLMPKLIHLIAKIKIREVFTVGTILILLGTAYLTHLIGLSFALGAFIAGLILSESDYNHQILAEVQPMKDSFNSIFFVSIGLLLNFQFITENPLLIVLLTISVLLIKTLIIFAIVIGLKYPARTAIISGLGLAQIGEFSFVLALAGNNYNLFTEDIYNIFLASSIFTMILTPFLFKLSTHLGSKTANFSLIGDKTEVQKKVAGHVIIAGFGLNGQNLSRVLKETGIRYIVIEINPDTVKSEKNKGEEIIYGDIGSSEILNQSGIERANIIVFAISDPPTTRRALSLAKKMNPKIYAVVRTRSITEIDELKKLGADVVIPEEFETALQIFRKVLERYHIPLNVIMKQTTLLREESYSLLRKENADLNSFIHLDEILAQGLTETYYVNEDNINIGKSIGEINLRAQSDATIIAIIRNGVTLSNPPARETLNAADTIVIYGTHQSVDKAIEILNGEEVI